MNRNRSLGLLGLPAVFGLMGITAHAQEPGMFKDVPKNHWAYQAVYELKQKGILEGYPNGTYDSPDTAKTAPAPAVQKPAAVKAKRAKGRTAHPRR